MKVEVKRDGLTLRGIEERAGGNSGPMAIMFHGFNGDIGYGPEDLFVKISERLIISGISTIRFDFDGHGKSDGNFSDMDVLKEIEDAIAILKYVRSLEYVTDIFVIGHSQGGVVGGMLSGLYPDIVDRMVLLAAAATLKDDALSGTCMGVKYDTDHIPDIVSINGGSTNVGGQYFRIAKKLPIYEVTADFKNPALIIYGRKDEVVAVKAAENYSRILENGRLQIYDDLNHGIEGNDRENVINEIVGFLE